MGMKWIHWPMTNLLQKSKTSTKNDKVVKEQCLLSRSSEGQCLNAALWKRLDLSNNVCEYEVNQLTNEKII